MKIENTAVARPQTGLEQADVVWETIVEFDVSRFIAVFHSQVPAEVGPDPVGAADGPGDPRARCTGSWRSRAVSRASSTSSPPAACR